MAEISKETETIYYNKLYTGATKDEIILKDIKNKRFYRFLKIALAAILGAIPAIGSLASLLAKLF